MRPAAIENSTLTIDPPKDWDVATQGPCHAIRVRVEDIDGLQFLRTAWAFEPEDLARANAGATLILGIQGSVHPVLHLLMGDPPGDRPAGVVSPSFVLTEDERWDGSLWLRCVARYGERELWAEVCLRDRVDEVPLPRAQAAGTVIAGVEQQARSLGLLPA